jgi:dTDP-4-amino-4,6-dideoxygalactose transaminase
MTTDKTIPLFKVHMAESAIVEVTKVLKSGFIGQGAVVEEFEKDVKTHFNHDFVLTLNSATSAEHLALHMLKTPSVTKEVKWPGMQTGDEVLTTALTCTATNWPILANGMKIKWVDIDPATLNMDLDDLSRKITSTTKVIMIVHWGGYPIDLDKLKAIQDNAYALYGFKPAIIEDCAHAIGAKYKGKLIGTHGNICTFSLQAIKHVTSGDGGLLFLPDQTLFNRGKLLRWYGIDRDTNKKDFRCEADVAEWGFKFHMNDINAAIGKENFKCLDDIVGKHIENGKFYDKELANVKGVTLLKRNSDFESAYWIYSILVERRDDFAKYMKEKGIMTSQVHERNDIHTCIRESKSMLPGLDSTIQKVSSIPVGWWVTPEDRQYIVDCIKHGW